MSDDDDASKREFLITELPCSLGRAHCNEGGSIVVDCNDVLLSRQHVQIKWSQEVGWLLTCLSKNGCTVDKKRYGKAADVPIKNGSAIRIGNARLYFTLPVVEEAVTISPTVSTKKRTFSETLPETDGEEGDLIMAMPGSAFSPAGSSTLSSSSRLTIISIFILDTPATLSPHTPYNHYLHNLTDISERRAPVRSESYLAMIEAAFECADLPQDENER